MPYDAAGNYYDDPYAQYADWQMPGSTVNQVQAPADTTSGTLNPSEAINSQNPTADPSKPYVQAGTTGGYLDGVGITVGAGSSTTPAQADAYLSQAQAAGFSDADVQAFLAANPNDYSRIYSALVNDGGGGSTGSGTGTSGWFGANAPGGTGSGFPQVSPYGDQYSTLARPSWLQGPYTPPTWGGLSLAELQATPGYQARLDAGEQALQRGAAAQGSILSGGSQKALERYGQNFAANEYANEYARRYGAFIDSANLGQQGRLINENAYQSDVGNNFTQYKSRYQQYLDLISNNRNAQNDYWSMLNNQTQNSLQAAALARP